MIDAGLSPLVPPLPLPWPAALEAIEKRDVPRIRPAVATLVADRENRETILSNLLRIVNESSNIVYGETPAGVRPGEAPKYRAMVEAATVQQAAIQAILGAVGADRLLDEDRYLSAVDRSGMLHRLTRWPEQIASVRREAEGATARFRSKYGRYAPRKIQVFGVGGSGAPHDIAAQVISNYRKSAVQIQVVHADEPNPDYTDSETLAILSSFSGNTEETLRCYEVLRAKAGSFLAIGQGGRLRKAAQRDGIPFLQLPENREDPAYVLQPRESVCLQMTAILSFLAAARLPPGSAGSLTLEDLDLDNAVSRIRSWQSRFEPRVPYRENPAKKLAAFLLYGTADPADVRLAPPHIWDKRIPFVVADRNNRALAHEVRTQLHERSKLNAACYDAPECLHNLVESIRACAESAVAGLEADRWVYYILRSSDDEDRIGLRLGRTIDLVMRGRTTYAVLTAEGDNPFHRALFVTYFNAWMTTYLAVLNGFDPLPVPTMSWLKNVMGDIPRGGDLSGALPKTAAAELLTRQPPVDLWVPGTAADAE